MRQRKKSIRTLFNQTIRLGQPPLSLDEELKIYQEINEQIETRISEIRLMDASPDAKVWGPLMKLHNELKPIAAQLLWVNLLDKAGIRESLGSYHPADKNPFMVGIIECQKGGR